MKIFISAFTTTIGAILLGLALWYRLPAVFIIMAGAILGVGWFIAEFGEGRENR